MAKKRKIYGIVLFFKILFYGVAFVPWILVFLMSKIKINITLKITIVFTVMYGIMMTIFIIILLTFVNATSLDSEVYATRVRMLSIIFLYLVSLYIAATGAFASQYMLAPIRNMANQMQSISYDNISTRIEVASTKDELHLLGEQINRALDEIEESVDRQQHFVADAGHELKTPISVIRGNADMLLRWGKDDRTVLEDGLRAIIDETKTMQAITEQLLTLASVGTFVPVFGDINICILIKAICDSYASNKDVHVVADVSYDSFVLRTDPQLLTQAVRALIDNAIKYSHKQGKIIVGIAITISVVEIFVLDRGIGISQEDLTKIFDRFFRADKARTRSSRGTGLGLSITKSIVEVLGGHIVVNSLLGSGSRFSIKFDKLAR